MEKIPTESKQDTSKELILQAARVAFSKFGYKKTTLDDIASQINMVKTGIYYYYKNKDEIFKEVIKKEACVMQNIIQLAISKEKEPIAQFNIYIEARMRFLEGISNFYSVLKHELFERLQFINQHRTEFDKAELVIISGILNDGIKKGIFGKADVSETSSVILSLLKGLELPYFGSEEKTNYQASLPVLIHLLLHGLVKK